MSTLPQQAVVQAFLVDHRKFMRLLLDVEQALRAGDIDRARVLGEALDKTAGPHIAFEEEVLYPTLAERTKENAFVVSLYDEHQDIVAALASLLEEREVTPARQQELQRAFTEGLAHAEHCGTLVSQLAELDEVDQEEALDELKQWRARGVRWTELRRNA